MYNSSAISTILFITLIVIIIILYNWLKKDITTSNTQKIKNNNKIAEVINNEQEKNLDLDNV